MDTTAKPYVHLAIDAVDAVVFDADGRYNAELYDHYATFGEARDAALTSVELMLDERDYDGDDHREELERMLALLEGARDLADLEREPSYRWFLGRLGKDRTVAA